MEIHVEAINDFDTIQALGNVVLCGKHKPNNVRTLLCVIIGIAGFFTVLSTFMTGLDEVTSVFIFLLLACLLFVIYAFRFMPKINYEGLGVYKGSAVSYVFYDTYYSVDIRADYVRDHMDAGYKALMKAMETDRYLIFFMQGSAGNVIDKSRLSAEDLFKIETVLKSTLGDKYIRCNY